MVISIKKPLSFSEIGRKDNQEDYLYPNPTSVDTGDRVFILCDGMGGHSCGEVASSTVAEALGAWLNNHLSNDGALNESSFESALNAAYDALDPKDNGDAKKMGTTMTCLCLHQGGALIAHIGDSRVYQIRPRLHSSKDGRSGIIFQTSDHSLVNDLLKAGELTEEEASTYPHKNIITRAIQPNLEARPKADIFKTDDVEAGDWFFMCSDGVLEQLTNSKLAEILSETTTSDSEKLQRIKHICDDNTKDNYTCWLIHVDNATGKSKQAEDVVIADIENSDTSSNNRQKSKKRTRFIRALISLAILVIGLAALLTLVDEKIIEPRWRHIENAPASYSKHANNDTIASPDKSTADIVSL